MQSLAKLADDNRWGRKLELFETDFADVVGTGEEIWETADVKTVETLAAFLLRRHLYIF